MRNLKADEIEVRILEVNQYGCSLFLYKDARCDQRILDEAFGAMNWQRTHEQVYNNLYCTVSIWDNDKKVWVYKQDAGTQSSLESGKGHASDSFKRACVNWGIGRELYTAPFIWVALSKGERTEYEKGKFYCSTKFSVREIGYKDKVIVKLTIQDEQGDIRFSFPIQTNREEIIQVKNDKINNTVKMIIDKWIINQK